MSRVLLIEDNDVNRDMLRKRLERRGFVVLEAATGERGLELARAERPDAVLMDLGLPDVDGWEATRRLRADPATATLPVVAVSAHVAPEDRAKAFAAGCDDFEAKPVQLDSLVAKIAAAIVKHGGSASPAPDAGPLPRPVESPPTAVGGLSEPLPIPIVAPVPAAPAGERKRILVVEDNDPNRVMLCRRLQKQGYDTAEARDGREGLALAYAHRFDLMLCDIMMPEVDGYQVLQTLKADPDMEGLPVIMISAVDEMASVVRCIELGAEDYLQKPYDPVLLQARITACLDKRRLRDQEMAYLRAVADLTQAAAMVETGDFDPALLAAVSARDDALGTLARVFAKMAREVQAKVTHLTREVQRLTVEIDEARKTEQVAQITDNAYFQNLQQKAAQLRRRRAEPNPPAPFPNREGGERPATGDATVSPIAPPPRLGEGTGEGLISPDAALTPPPPNP